MRRSRKLDEKAIEKREAKIQAKVDLFQQRYGERLHEHGWVYADTEEKVLALIEKKFPKT